MNNSKNQLTAFIFGLGASITIRIVGLFAISDIIAIVSLPFLIFNKNIWKDKTLKTLIILCICWMLSTIISDIYNKTPIIDALKGFFSIIPFLGCLIFAYIMILKDNKLMIPFLWGYAVSFLLGAGFGLDQFYKESIEYKGFGDVTELMHYNKIIVWIINAFVTGAFAITFYRNNPRFVTVVIFTFSFIPLLEGSRSLFLISFFTAFFLLFNYYFLQNLNLNTRDGKLKRRKRIRIFFVFSIIIFFLATNIYEGLVTQGYLGEEEYKKYEMQKSTDIGLLSGRAETIGAILALYDSPILGHGSYAKDYKGYGVASALLAGLPIQNYLAQYKSDENYMPAHSHFWGAWVNNGIMGGVFWLYVLLAVLLKFLRRYFFLFKDYQAYLMLGILSTTWNILFSPFSQKPFLGTTLAFLLVLMHKENKKINLIKFPLKK